MQFGGQVVAPVESARMSRKGQLAALLVIVVLQLPIGGFLVRGNTLNAQVGREGIFWVLTLFLIVWILVVERRPLRSVGLSWPTLKSVAFGIVGALGMVAGIATIYMVIFPALGLSTNEATMAAVKATPLWFRVLLILRAAVFEEIFYRGFMIERLTELTRVRWLAALISLTAFTLAHLGGWGWAHLMIAGFGGIVLTALYVFRRDLASNMIAHFLTDAVGFLVA
jgi:membrane protease YdiL (CAAX protease family)